MNIGALIPSPSGLSRERSWRYIGIHEAHPPLARFPVHSLEPTIVPILLDVAKCGVVYAPFSIHLGPGNGEIAVFPVNAWIIQIEFVRVEPHQDANLVTREVFHLINLVLQNKGLRPRLHAREVWIFDDNGCSK